MSKMSHSSWCRTNPSKMSNLFKIFSNYFTFSRANILNINLQPRMFSQSWLFSCRYEIIKSLGCLRLLLTTEWVVGLVHLLLTLNFKYWKNHALTWKLNSRIVGKYPFHQNLLSRHLNSRKNSMRFSLESSLDLAIKVSFS